jgi:hypothetical protein
MGVEIPGDGYSSPSKKSQWSEKKKPEGRPPGFRVVATCKLSDSAPIEACRAAPTIVIICRRYQASKLSPNFKIPNIYSAF